MSCTKPDRVYLVATSFFLGFCSIYCPFFFNHLFFLEKQTKTRSPALLSLLAVASMFRQMLRFAVLVWRTCFPDFDKLEQTLSLICNLPNLPQIPLSGGGLQAKTAVQISCNTWLSDRGVAVGCSDTVTPAILCTEIPQIALETTHFQANPFLFKHFWICLALCHTHTLTHSTTPLPIFTS